MSKSETREVEQLLKTPHYDIMVRGMSTLIRAARNDKSRRALLEIAYRNRAHLSPEFIIG